MNIIYRFRPFTLEIDAEEVEKFSSIFNRANQLALADDVPFDYDTNYVIQYVLNRISQFKGKDSSSGKMTVTINDQRTFDEFLNVLEYVASRSDEHLRRVCAELVNTLKLGNEINV